MASPTGSAFKQQNLWGTNSQTGRNFGQAGTPKAVQPQQPAPRSTGGIRGEGRGVVDPNFRMPAARPAPSQSSMPAARPTLQPKAPVAPNQSASPGGGGGYGAFPGLQQPQLPGRRPSMMLEQEGGFSDASVGSIAGPERPQPELDILMNMGAPVSANPKLGQENSAMDNLLNLFKRRTVVY